MIPIERTHEYRGLYHVLGGALSPIDGIDADDLKIAELAAPRRRGRGQRGRARHQPDDHRRGDRAPHRRAAARPGRRSPAWPAACRSAPTSSTPTRSRSARRLAGAPQAWASRIYWTMSIPQIAAFRVAAVRSFRQGLCVARNAGIGTQEQPPSSPASSPRDRFCRRRCSARCARRCRDADVDAFAGAAQRLAEAFGAVTAAAVDPSLTRGEVGRTRPSLYRPGHMQRRLGSAARDAPALRASLLPGGLRRRRSGGPAKARGRG